MKILLTILLLFVGLAYYSCKKASNESYYDSVTCNNPDDSLNTYNLKIGQVLKGNCSRSGCHDSSTHKGGVKLDNYDNAVSSFENKDVLNAIYHGKHSKPMPQGGSKLSDDLIHDITCWVKNSYPK